jgi:hypothetical protein
VLAGILLSRGRSRWRALDQIEKSLLVDDPGLWSLFVVFTSLTQQEAMPGTERVRPRRYPSRERVIAIGLIVVLGALVRHRSRTRAAPFSEPGGQLPDPALTPDGTSAPMRRPPSQIRDRRPTR